MAWLGCDGTASLPSGGKHWRSGRCNGSSERPCGLVVLLLVPTIADQLEKSVSARSFVDLVLAAAAGFGPASPPAGSPVRRRGAGVRERAHARRAGPLGRHRPAAVCQPRSGLAGQCRTRPARSNWPPPASRFVCWMLTPTGATYYLAYAMPGQPIADWQAYGRTWPLPGADQPVLLRVAQADAERLAQAGVALRQVTLTPKPLRLNATGPTSLVVVQPDPIVQTMIDQVNATVVYSYTGDLSGEWPVYIGGAPYTITTRNTYSGTPIQKATQFAGEHLADLGLDVEYHQWSGADLPQRHRRAAGADQPGRDLYHLRPPGRHALLAATRPAPTTMPAARWPTLHRRRHPDPVPVGLHAALCPVDRRGAGAAGQRGLCPALRTTPGRTSPAYLNLDMIAWNTPAAAPTSTCTPTPACPATLELAQLFADVVDAYNLNLVPEIKPNGTGASDHASFWQYGYTGHPGHRGHERL